MHNIAKTNPKQKQKTKQNKNKNKNKTKQKNALTENFFKPLTNVLIAKQKSRVGSY